MGEPPADDASWTTPGVFACLINGRRGWPPGRPRTIHQARNYHATGGTLSGGRDGQEEEGGIEEDQSTEEDEGIGHRGSADPGRRSLVRLTVQAGSDPGGSHPGTGREGGPAPAR